MLEIVVENGGQLADLIDAVIWALGYQLVKIVITPRGGNGYHASMACCSDINGGVTDKGDLLWACF